MKHVKSFNNGAEYVNKLNEISYPAVSLIYDEKKPDIPTLPIEGVFIEATDGSLVKTEDWNDSKTANCIYVSDGYRKVRLSLHWCNDSNCQATHASSNSRWGGTAGSSTFSDDGNGSVYGVSIARMYRWYVGPYSNYRFNNGVMIDCLSYYDSWDWEGKKVTETIMNNSSLKDHFPAMKAAYTYMSPNGEHGYLMGISELQMVFGYGDKVNAALVKCGGTKFDYDTGEDIPWSCSCQNLDSIWSLDTSVYGGMSRNFATGSGMVRAAF